MKKVILTLLVVALAIPAMAADISLVDNGDLTGTVRLTSVAGENVRGLAIILTADSAATISNVLAGVGAELNVNMDAAYEAPGTYAVGDGVTKAVDPAGKGTLGAGDASIAICLGKLDQGLAQAPIAAGTIDIATIAVSAACFVTIEADIDRGGGIVGDALVAGTIVGGPITDGGPECVKDTAPFYADWVTFGSPACWCYEYQCRGDIDGITEGAGPAGVKRVYNLDLTIFLTAYGVKEPNVNPAWGGPGIGSVPGGICADIDHAPEGAGPAGVKRVYNLDLTALLVSYGVKEPNVNPAWGGPGIAPCDASDYNFFVTP